MEFRQISAIVEYREKNVNSLHERFGIEGVEEFTPWKPQTGP